MVNTAGQHWEYRNSRVWTIISTYQPERTQKSLVQHNSQIINTASYRRKKRGRVIRLKRDADTILLVLGIQSTGLSGSAASLVGTTQSTGDTWHRRQGHVNSRGTETCITARRRPWKKAGWLQPELEGASHLKYFERN